MALFQPIQVTKNKNDSRPIDELLLAWPDSFYNEKDGTIRRAMLDGAIEKNLSPSDDAIRDEILKRRYPGLLANGLMQDLFMSVWLNIKMAQESAKSRFAKRRGIRLVRDALKILGEDELREKYGQRGVELLELEAQHLAKVYMNLCSEDKQYCSYILGIGRMKDENIAGKISEDAYVVSRLIPEQLQITEECALWTRAVEAAYRELFPGSNYFEERAQEN